MKDLTPLTQALLQPYKETDLEIYPVSREVSYPKNDYAGLLESIWAIRQLLRKFCRQLTCINAVQHQVNKLKLEQADIS